MAIFQVDLGSPVPECLYSGFYCELRMMEAVVTTAAIGRAKLQDSNRHHQQTQHPVFLQAGCPSCCPTKSVRALKENWNINWF